MRTDHPTMAHETGLAKDHAEHLRTVHFSMIAVSFALAVVISSRVPSEIAHAFEQIGALTTLDAEWNEAELIDQLEAEIGRSLEAWKQRRLAGDDELLRLPKGDWRQANHLQFSEPLAAEVVGQSRSIKLEFSPHNWIIGKYEAGARGTEVRWFLPLFPAELPHTLDSFRGFWSDLVEQPTVFIPLKPLSDTLYATRYELARASTVADVKLKRVEPLPPTTQLEGLFEKLTLRPVNEPKLRDHIAARRRPAPLLAYSAAADREKSVRISIPVLDVITFRLDAQGLLLKRMREFRGERGSFENTFQDLDRVTKEYQDLPLRRIKRLIEDETIRRREETPEVFGTRVPPQTATRWGVVILVALQLYFWLHLKKLAELIKTADDSGVAWIGLYDAVPARVAFLASATLLPVAVVAYLGWVEHTLPRTHPGWLWFVGGFAALSLCFAISGGLAWHESQKRRSRCQADVASSPPSTTPSGGSTLGEP